MRKRLTESQVIFAKEFVENGQNGKAAAMVAYPDASPDSAKVTASRNLDNPKILSLIENALNKKGVTEDAIAETISDALKAKKSYVQVESFGRGESSSSLVESEVPDHATRLKAAEMATKLKGLNAPEVHKHEFQGVLATGTIREIREALQG